MPAAIVSVLACLCVSACASGREIPDKQRFFGCYSYSGVPVLLIENDKVANARGSADDFTRVEGFRTIKGRELVLTKNPILFDPKKGVRFGRANTGYFHELEREGQGSSLVVQTYDDRDIKLVRSGKTCEPI